VQASVSRFGAVVPWFFGRCVLCRTFFGGAMGSEQELSGVAFVVNAVLILTLSVLGVVQ
jgi:hypothetical protein